MTHFALVCPPFPSHVRAFEAVAERLVARGHRATFLLPADARALVRSGTVGTAALPAGRLIAQRRRMERAGRPNGPFGILRTVRDSARATDALCREGPAILRLIGAEAILGDEMEPAAGLLARHLSLPHVSIACALPMERERAIPPPFLDWPFDPSPEGLKRNRGAERVTRLFLRRQRRTIVEWALRFALPGVATMEDCLSPVCTVAQTVAGFDFPRRATTRIRAVGPLRAAAPAQAPLPFTLDPGRPLVYASLGSMQGHRLSVFRAIAMAARAADFQLVVSHGGGLTEREALRLGALYAAPDLPQDAVLARAAVCVTHGGLNTVLDALAAGVPLLAVPIAFDQPGVAARIERSGAGLKLSRVLLSSRPVREALERLVGDDRFRVRAAALGEEIAAAGGADAAVRHIEAAVAPAPFAQAAE